MDRLAAARSAIADVAPAFVHLVRKSVHDRIAVGDWTVGDVAHHVCLAIEVDTDALTGQPLPVATLSRAGVAAMNDAYLAADPERDLDILANRVERLLTGFLAASAAPVQDEVAWLDGAILPASAVACHLLEELLVHGFDIARATKTQWVIDPAHAALAIAGAVAPIVNAAGPKAFVDPDHARGFQARLEVRLRGHDRLTFAFDDGLTVTENAAEPADVYVSADPSSMLLFMLDRESVASAALRGKVALWGRRPWCLPRILRTMAPP